MTEKTITTARSLHARPASQLAKTAAAFASQITVNAGDKQANAKSVLALMGLGVTAGADVSVRAEGADAEDAVDAVVRELITPEPAAVAAEPKGA